MTILKYYDETDGIWKPFVNNANDAVTLSGDQTIAGKKTFTEDMDVDGDIYSNGVKVGFEKDLMLIKFATSPTYFKLDTNWVAKIMPLNHSEQTLTTGSRLSYSSNGIKIGSGVSKVKIDSMVNFYTEGETPDISIIIFKNGVRLSQETGYVKMPTVSYGQLVGMPIYLDVAENDLLQMGVTGNSTTNRRYFNMTHMQVEVVG